MLLFVQPIEEEAPVQIQAVMANGNGNADGSKDGKEKKKQELLMEMELLLGFGSILITTGFGLFSIRGFVAVGKFLVSIRFVLASFTGCGIFILRILSMRKLLLKSFHASQFYLHHCYILPHFHNYFQQYPYPKSLIFVPFPWVWPSWHHYPHCLCSPFLYSHYYPYIAHFPPRSQPSFPPQQTKHYNVSAQWLHIIFAAWPVVHVHDEINCHQCEQTDPFYSHDFFELAQVCHHICHIYQTLNALKCPFLDLVSCLYCVSFLDFCEILAEKKQVFILTCRLRYRLSELNSLTISIIFSCNSIEMAILFLLFGVRMFGIFITDLQQMIGAEGWNLWQYQEEYETIKSAKELINCWGHGNGLKHLGVFGKYLTCLASNNRHLLLFWLMRELFSFYINQIIFNKININQVLKIQFIYLQKAFEIIKKSLNFPNKIIFTNNLHDPPLKLVLTNPNPQFLKLPI